MVRLHRSRYSFSLIPFIVLKLISSQNLTPAHLGRQHLKGFCITTVKNCSVTVHIKN